MRSLEALPQTSSFLFVYLCYLDESGTVEPSGTTHFILLGLAVPAPRWKQCDAQIAGLKARHGLANREVHTAWMMRRFPEQERIPGFAALDERARRAAVTAERKADLAKAALRGPQAVKTLARNYKKSDDYIHLTHAERVACARDIADAIGSWTDVTLFCDAQDKSAHRGTPEALFSFAFEQIVSRFQMFLNAQGGPAVGLLVQDNNQTAAAHLTSLMRRFHARGTAFASIERIVETPLFVDSQLTSMVQLADLASFAVRRFFENKETDLFDRVYPRFDRAHQRLVGLRHFTGKAQCACRVCVDHGRPSVP